MDDKTITFIDGDRFLVRQEGHTGYMHLYLYSIRKGLLAQVTKGDWEVTDVVGTDGKRVWYLSTETSPLRRNLYSVRLDGKDKHRLTTGEGYYAIAPSAGMKYYISPSPTPRPPTGSRSATTKAPPSARWPTAANSAKSWRSYGSAPSGSSSPSRPSAATRSMPTSSSPAASIPRSATPCC